MSSPNGRYLLPTGCDRIAGVQAVLIKVSIVEHVVEYDGGTLFAEWIETDKKRFIRWCKPNGYVIQLEESRQSVGGS